VIFTIRDARPEDQVPIQDCDIKCFDFAWDTDSWAFVGGNYVVKVATYYGTTFGFTAFLHDEDERIVHVPKIAVKVPYRNMGVGRKLLKEAIVFAQQVKARHLECVLPESILRPGEPGFVGDWMNKMGWKATKLVPEFFPAMGQQEDGVTFILNL
jgi:ribosomal protein S18 acetylase RimI-like enzyme